MTNSGEVVWTALDGALPGIGLHGMTQDLMPGDMPANIRAALLHIAVIDSHSLTRECIANSVSYMSEDIKVFSFSSALDCNDRRTYQFSLIVLYLHGSEYEPLEVIRSLRSAHEESTIFVISDHDYQTNSEFIRVAWRLGARGFVSTRTTGLTLALRCPAIPISTRLYALAGAPGWGGIDSARDSRSGSSQGGEDQQGHREGTAAEQQYRQGSCPQHSAEDAGRHASGGRLHRIADGCGGRRAGPRHLKGG
jgi:hypothetical protein